MPPDRPPTGLAPTVPPSGNIPLPDSPDLRVFGIGTVIGTTPKQKKDPNAQFNEFVEFCWLYFFCLRVHHKQ